MAAMWKVASERTGELVVPGRDGAVALEGADPALDGVPLLVDGAVESGWAAVRRRYPLSSRWRTPSAC
jgi:hypothetical protein